ncbi:MAG: cupin domain-containing protein [Burkholderiales bacterium]
MAQRLLGNLSPSLFLRRHWQKQPLLVREAVPRCGEWLHRDTLFALACRDDVESRIVTRAHNRWHVEHGPFTLASLRRRPTRGWTLLVQGVEQFLPDATALLQKFSFIPHARLDDLMVSYAAPGGGVGPHFDSYDVFLLQGAGSRHWRISAQKELALIDNAPLRILKNFRSQQAWSVEQGDLLYLPPRYAHDGVAVDTCMTLSVGFRTPRKQELAANFLDFLQDHLQIEGMIGDAGLPLQRHPAQLPAFLVDKFAQVLTGVRWSNADVWRFAGGYLTEPKPQTVFSRPRRPLPLSAFIKRLMKRGAQLALPTRMLFNGKHFFINGECHLIENPGRSALICLADRRATPAFVPDASTARLMHAWYCAGYIDV